MKRVAERKTIDEILKTLPNGCVTRKVISGKERFYLQWREGGKTRSRYLKVDEVDDVREQVRRRKALEAKVREGKKGLKQKVRAGEDLVLETDVLCGAELRRHVRGVAGWGRRDAFSALAEYLGSDECDRVFVVYGLRRTGKTTMLRQAMGDLLKTGKRKVAYIRIGKHNVLEELGRDLKKLARAGYTAVFVDEVTLMADFIDGAAMLSDVYAGMGMKIVLSGTDSLGFFLAAQDSLYDRAYMIHTTFIPFSEHARLLGTDDIDGYIGFGGTLRKGELDFTNPAYQSEEVSFRSDESTRRYIDTAISRNIQHSLACCQEGGRFYKLRGLYERGELTGAINRVIEDMNHRFLLEVLTRDFKSRDLGSAAQLLASAKDPRRRSDALTLVDRKAVVRRLMDILEIRNRENQTIGLTQDHANLIREYLKALDLIVSCEIEHLGVASGVETRDLFVQPGMRYCQAQALVDSLLRDDYFAGLDVAERELVTNRILEDVRGSMLEDIVLLETKRRAAQRDRVLKVVFEPTGEIDMLVYRAASASVGLYEIKHATGRDAHQVRHLLNPKHRALVERRYGKVSETVVLYRGNQVEERGVSYWNVNEYLKGLS